MNLDPPPQVNEFNWIWLKWMNNLFVYLRGLAAGQIAFTQTGTGAVATTVDAKLKESVSVKDFGALADGSDDTAAIQAAINHLSNNPAATLHIPAGTYTCSGNIYTHYDATLNPNFKSGSLLGGRMTIVGEGQMHLRDWVNTTYTGSVLSFADDKGLILGNGGTQRTWVQSWQNISVVGDHSGKLVNANYLGPYNLFRNLFIGNDDRSGTGTAFAINDMWSSTCENFDIVGRKDLGTGVGEGFTVETTVIGSGNNSFRNINSSYFETGFRFGHAYDAGLAGIADMMSNANIVECQGLHNTYGAKFLHGFVNAFIQNFWTENNSTAGILIKDSCEGLTFWGGNFTDSPGTGVDDGVIILGGTSGTATLDNCKNIVFDGSYFFNASPCIRKHPAATDIIFRNSKVYNGGTCFISATAGDGGEVILEDNNYYPSAAASELPSARRCCVVTAGPTYTDAAYLLRRADFAKPKISGTLDMEAWRYAAEELSCNTTGADVTIKLPLALTSAVGRKVTSRIYKPNAANTVIIDTGTGGTIQGSQTLVLSATYSVAKVEHTGTGSTNWEVVGN